MVSQKWLDKKRESWLKSIKAYNKGYCSICGSYKRLIGHHEDYREIENKIYICNKCHQLRHNNNMEFINDKKTKDVFASHGFDVVEITRRKIKGGIKKYKQYYREYIKKCS